MKIIKVVLLGMMALSVFASAQMKGEKLRYVTDGDTVVFSKTTCRLAYIDTPESKMNKKLKKDIRNSSVTADEVIKAGRISKNYLKSIMQKGDFYHFKVINVDRYGRSVCVIKNHQGKSINDMVVKNGFAVPFWRYVPMLVKPKMIALVKSAKYQNKGLWRTNPNVLNMMN